MPEATEHYVQAPAMTTPTPLAFAVRRREPVLVGPAAPTPRETKRLSDIDDQETLRGHVPFLFFYRGGGDDARDPAAAIRRALGEALVPYYPLAGRLREVEGRKLVVDCTAEGVMFVEADADVRLAELEAASGGLRPPFPCVDQLLFDVDGSGGVLNCPLLLIQVTRLLCGGFVLALQFTHTICDAIAIAQFMSATAELVRGLPAPTVTPAWSRELLQARSPPRQSFPHREFDAVPSPPPPPPQQGDMITRTFTFSPAGVTAIKRGLTAALEVPADEEVRAFTSTRRDVAAIKGSLPTRLHGTATTFEVLTAALWRARTAALELPPHEEVRLAFIVSFRGVHELGIPAGYYGNAIVPSAVLATAGELQASPLGDTVEMVREAKAAAVTAEYVRSTIDLLVLRGRPNMLATANLFVVSDHRHLGLHRLDLGWGVPVYGGIADVFYGAMFLVAARDDDGEDAVAVPIILPRPAMDRFASELEKMVSPSLVDEHSSDNEGGLLASR